MIGTVRFAQDVRITGCPSPAQSRIIAALDTVARAMGRDFTVTCGEEAHPPVDPHTLRKAFDVRTLDFDHPKQIVEAFKRIQDELGTAYWTVLYEVPSRPDDPVLRDLATVNPNASGQHFHIQPHKGTDYPPVPEQP
jgi:hypothetical protein